MKGERKVDELVVGKAAKLAVVMVALTDAPLESYSVGQWGVMSDERWADGLGVDLASMMDVGRAVLWAVETVVE